MEVQIIFYLVGSDRNCDSSDRNSIIFQEYIFRQAMFYQTLPLRNSFGFLPMAVMPSPDLLLIQTLAHALEKSVTNYSLTFEQHFSHPVSQEVVVSSQAVAKRGKTSLQVPPKEETGTRQNEKNSEFQSQKIVSLVTINESKSSTQGQCFDLQTESKLKDEANIPSFGLSCDQRQIKMASLLERRVEGWKIQRQRKKSTRVTYNWC